MKPQPDLRSNSIDQRISPFLREAHTALIEAAGLKSGTRMAVLECRDGWAAEEAWRRVKQGYICGVDASHTMITLAQQYRAVPGRLEFEVWDRTSLPFADDSFDVLISSYSIDRFQDPMQMLREAARVLVPGGRLLLLEPTRYSFGGLYLFVDWFYRRVDPGHVRYYTQAELREMLQNAGFEETTIRGRFQKLLSGGKVFANWVLLENRLPGR